MILCFYATGSVLQDNLEDNSSNDVISFDDVSHQYTDEVEGTLNHVTLITPYQ